ncbi:MAG TPA: hypothetical protein VGX23_28815 [Actinocrinis sp.]|nr:hypothetical protein [Actinocrinis sp.]
MPLFNRLRRNSPGAGVLKRCRAAVGEVNALEPQVRKLTDEGLRATGGDLRRRLAGGADPAALLPQAFATVREAAWRTIGQRVDDEQIMGGVALHLGVLAEMKTGEGKTLTITLPAYLNGLSGQGVHVITGNDFLAARDAEWMGPVYRALGLECALVRSEDKRFELARHRAAYAADVTYGTLSEMACDYLRDNRVSAPDQLIQRGRGFLIVDEADQVMIDEARSVPSIFMEVRAGAEQSGKAAAEVKAVARAAEEFERGVHYGVDESRKMVTLTDAGIARAEEWFEVANFYGSVENGRLRILLENAIMAKDLFARDRDYVVVDGAILVVDVVSGRVRPQAVYDRGLAQAIEAKEGLLIEGGSVTVANISAHQYLRLYDRLAGVTAVAVEAEAYRRVYGLETVVIPTHRPVLRVDRPIAVFQNDRFRLGAVVEAVAAKRAAGRPVLIGAGSVEQSEQVSGALSERGIPHRVLNARNHQAEGKIIAEAGRVGAVTVVTRMAGRGVDIPLGGDDPAEHECVVTSGGLYVLATDLYETRRLGLHMRGRAGRRGDPGESDVFLSCEDATLLRMLGPKLMAQVAGAALGSSKVLRVDFADRFFTRIMEAGLNERTARQVRALVSTIPVDDVIGERREAVYRLRREFFAGNVDTAAWVRQGIDELVTRHVADCTRDSDGLKALWMSLGVYYPIGVTAASLAGLSAPELEHVLREDAQSAYSRREASLADGGMRALERRVVLGVINRAWREFLAEDVDLAAATGLHSLTGGDFYNRYRRDSSQMFDALLVRIQEDSIGYLFNLDVEMEAEGTLEEA